MVSEGTDDGRETGGDRAVAHLTSRWNTHCPEDMHAIKPNTASRDTPFLLRLEIAQTTMVKPPRTQTCSLYIRAQVPGWKRLC